MQREASLGRRRRGSRGLVLIVAAGAALTACRRDARGARPGASAPAVEGCGHTYEGNELWVVESEAAIDAKVQQAMRCGRARNTRVLLEFIADWCPDCRVMTDLERAGEPAAVLRDQYERVRVHVGHWDRHEALRRRFGIDRIAAYVVLDPATGERVAQTTVEPVTGGHGPMTPAMWAAWLRAPTDAAPRAR